MTGGGSPPREATFLSVRNLEVRFGEVRAVRNVGFTARRGETIAVFGANGSGKTTLLKAIAGLVPVEAGRIRLEGEEITPLPAHARVARGVQYVSDRARVALKMSVRENLEVGGYLKRGSARRESLDRVLRLFPVLREKVALPAGILSGGERQMLVIGRALMGNPSLLLLDEPFLGLALPVRDRIIGILEETLRGKATILFAEHELGAAFRILDRSLIFRNGVLIHEAGRAEAGDEERLRELFRKYSRGRGKGSGADPEDGGGR